MRHLLIGFTILFASVSAFAQSLCGVASAGKSGNEDKGFHFTFDGRSDSRVSLLHDKGETDFDLKAGVLSAAGKKVAAIETSLNANAYVVQGSEKSCVIRFEERDGVPGIYIEEHILTRGKPPELRSEFVEVR